MAKSPPVQQRGAILFARLCLENTPVLLCLIMSIIRCERKTKHMPAVLPPSLPAAQALCMQMLLGAATFGFITALFGERWV